MAPPRSRRWCVVALLLGAASREASCAEEVYASLPRGGRVALSTKGPSAFRVRLLRPNDLRPPIDTPLVGPGRADAAFSVINENGVRLATSFGSVQVTSAGILQLFDEEGKVIARSPALSCYDTGISLTSSGGALYGRGASPDDCYSLTVPKSTPLVCNTATYVPYYYSTSGYGALGVVEFSNAQRLPADYSQVGSDTVKWSFQGPWDLYLMPANVLRRGTEAYYALIGPAKVSPLYTFGFMASRWGWKDRRYVEEVVQRFRRDKYPLDGIIMDFEWFTTESDYAFAPQGKSTYHDFGYNPGTLNEPRDQLKDLRDLGIRVGGIRKPRLGNSDLLDMARKKGWILTSAEPAGGWPADFAGSYAKQRCLNYSRADVREWYSSQLAGLYKDGMSFWWNDEGETDYFTFHYWNVAQLKALRMTSDNGRFYSLNRAWSPGMARLGATVWTGDVVPTWEWLAKTPGMMLNWVIAGAPYVGCDIGGFTGETNAALLTRWVELGVFMPTMRVHSTLAAKPHWPWLWGDQAAAAIKLALELRYRLIPYHYSLAHALHRDNSQWIRPLVMDWPGDQGSWTVTKSWMDGQILVAPVTRQDSKTEIYIPPGLWYPLAASTMTRGDGRPITGGVHLDGNYASLNHIPAFVQAGAVIPLAPVVQTTADLPGGPLEVQVYAGASGSFVLVEDDGETTDYERGRFRGIRFEWNDELKELSWSMDGFILAPGSHAFREVFATVVDSNGVRHSDVYPLGVTGSIEMSDNQRWI